MDEKSLTILEYFKVLEKLASYTAFSASAELARSLRPVSDLTEARRLQARTTEARRLLDINSGFTVGGAQDVRQYVDLAGHGGVLAAPEMLEVKNTLISARDLVRSFEKQKNSFPNLAMVMEKLPPPSGLIDAISRCISERGEVLDSASEKLATIRRDLRTSHERLLSRMERMVNDPKNAPMLQEAIITQRNGRYVIPLRAEFKGQIRSIIHDQSTSGATLFVEPLALVEMNNHWHELQLAERDEERRILADLSGQVGRNMEYIVNMVRALAEMDLLISCAQYAEDLHAAEPLLEGFSPRENHPGSIIRLYQARHPLLNQETVVSIDVDLDPKTFALVITGPNTGGKTVTLKTVGLLALMAQSGLHIPAQSGSSISVFENIFADIGDEQSIEQSLSTFSGHITNIVRILNNVSPRMMVLFDELGAGTDPQEGAALAHAILADLIQRQITCLVATHYPELKAFAHVTPGAINASMEFNLRTLRPTYHLNIGLPGRSNALLIAERLGLSQEILQTARAGISPEDLKAENLLDEIHRQRDGARRARSQAEEARKEAEKERREVEKRLEQIETERLALLEEARAEAEAELADMHQELEEVKRALQRARQPLEAIKPLKEQVEYLEDQVEKPLRRQKISEPTQKPLRVGEKVRLRSLRMEGVILSLGENEVEVQAGALRMRASLADIQRAGEVEEEKTAPAAAPAVKKRPPVEPARSSTPFYPSPGMELDLRGQRAEDALDALDRYMESAFLAGLPFVRIIHGKGTGKLRQEVRQALRHSTHVKSWVAGTEGEGGDGVTVVHLAVD